jgi:hypothetical protein
MHRISLLALGFILLFLTCASAEIYRCRTAAGDMVMTDNKAEIPADCQPVGEPAGSGSFNIVPEDKEIAVENPPISTGREDSAGTEDIVQWQKDASTLVESYRSAVLRSHRDDLEVDRRRATQQVEQLKQQKQEMLSALPGSRLKDHEQEAVQKILNEIPNR